jgi:2-keto-3-deoxy-L-rhamnonate aldolase RhmA
MIQIESPTGIANIEKLLDVQGIDAAFIGPNDLSQSMGIMGQMDNPDFIAAVQKVIDTAKAKKKFSGIHMMATAPLQKWIDKGMTLNLWGNDVTFLMNAAREGLAQLKKQK